MQCEHVKADGTRCRARSLRGDTRCWFHAPQLAAHRAEVRSRAGKMRQGRVISPDSDTPDSWRVRSVEDLAALLEWTIADCLKMDRSLARTTALTGLVRVGVALVEQTELAERIAAHDQQIAAIEAQAKAAQTAKEGRNGRFKETA